MKCDSRASFLARTFASPYLGRKPKARVTTKLGNTKLYLAKLSHIKLNLAKVGYLN
jgi:hypothetical protein